MSSHFYRVSLYLKLIYAEPLSQATHVKRFFFLLSHLIISVHTLIQFVFVFLNVSVDLVPGNARLWKTRRLWGQCYISLGCRLVLVHSKHLR